MQIKKGLRLKSSETLLIPAPSAEQFSNQLFGNLKKLYDLKPIINLDCPFKYRTVCLSSPK